MANPASAPPLPADLVALPAEAFVQAAAAALKVKDLPADEAHAFARALERGVTKTRVWHSLAMRAGFSEASAALKLPSAIMRPEDDIIVEDVLLGFAPDDDVAFLNQAFHRMLGRSPSANERMELEFDLRGGSLDRRGVLRKLSAGAVSQGRRPALGQIVEAGLIQAVRPNGVEQTVLVRKLAGADWIVASGALAQDATIEADGWRVSEGLLLDGPKQMLQPGRWVLRVDVLQPADAVLEAHIGANGHLETLLRQRLVGPALAQLEFEVKSEHLVVGVHLLAINALEPRWRISPREISLMRAEAR